jgi:hypothetical protein
MKHLKTYERFINESQSSERLKYKYDGEITFKGRKYKLDFGRYKNDRLAITLIDVKTGDDDITVTVNLPDENIDPKNIDQEIAIKDYSENEGILKVLKDAEIVSDVVRWADSGYVKIPIVHLLHSELIHNN